MDPLAKKIGKKAAQAVRQQVRDVGEEVKDIPKSGKQQITGKDEEAAEQTDDEKKDNSQSAKQQLLTLLRGAKNKTNQQKQAQQNVKTPSAQSTSNDDVQQKPRHEQLDRDIEKARRQRQEKEKQREAAFEQQKQMEEPQDRKQFTPPKGRKPRGMQNPMARKGKKKNELGRTAKG